MRLSCYLLFHWILVGVGFAAIPFSAQSADWITDFEQAKVRAQDEHKKILLVFSGSDWCAPCMLLDRNVLSHGSFQALADQTFVLVKVDFPRKKVLSREQIAHNRQLAERFDPHGHFPHLVVLDESGSTVLGECGYLKVSPEAFFHKLDSIHL